MLDGALSALGYSLFGDHLAAWLCVSLFWVALGVVAAATILRRLENPGGAVLVGLLIACGPLLLKDGLASNTVGHASTPVLALLGLLPLFPRSGRAPPGWRAGLLAGVVVGFAVWYQRTAVVAVPVLLLVASTWGRRVVLASLGGLVSFPLLVLLNAWILLDVGGRRADGQLFDVVRLALLGVEGGSTGERPWWRALADPLGFGLEPLLNAAVAGEPPATSQQLLPAVLGAVWPVLTVLGLGATLLTVRPATLRRLVFPALALGWTVGYAATSFEAEPTVFRLAEVDPPTGPTTSDARYLVPSVLLWTMVLAQGLGRWWHDLPLRWGAVALGGALAAGGLAVAARDVPPSSLARTAYAEVLPFDYVGVYGHWVGPTRRFHLSCSTRDPICRAHHLRTLGAWGEPSLRVMGDLRRPALVEQLTALVDETSAEPREAQFIAHGMGIEIANIVPTARSSEELLPHIARLHRELEEMPRGEAQALMRGLAEHAQVGQYPLDVDAQAALCEPVFGLRTLCSMLAGHVRWEGDLAAWTADAGEFASKVAGGAGTTAKDVEEIRLALLWGLGQRLGRSVPPVLWEALIAELDPVRARNLRDGLETGARGRWRSQPTVDTPAWKHP